MKNIAMKRFVPWLMELVAIVLIVVSFLLLIGPANGEISGYGLVFGEDMNLATVSFALCVLAVGLNAVSVINHSFIYKEKLSVVLDAISVISLIVAGIFYLTLEKEIAWGLMSASIVVLVAAALTAASCVIRALPIKK